MAPFNHLDAEGKARMVDVGAKTSSHRVAVASGWVALAPETVKAIQTGTVPKGDVLTVAKIAGIQGAKQTSNLIPLCHPLALDQIDLGFDVRPGGVRIEATAKVHAKTGVEMEALTAVCTAGLALIDMVKSADRKAFLHHVQLDRKEGGKSGTWKRDPGDDSSPSAKAEGA